ncbi:MAG TPA: hypothetical protein VIW47_07205 [Nitrospiraceae bacterium]|jgi:hypothetical protein
MSATLYLLRQQPDHISPSLFRGSDTDVDIVFIECAASIASSSMKEAVVNAAEMTLHDSRQTLGYEDLVEKIFSSERVIVI